ncbi:hypothetical protein BDZ89DRAFT_1152333 [Hymenopellis radicata]|nr:hypothetical protein BDZ89DRAFT_1152333 [Hymenopellis radicata]
MDKPKNNTTPRPTLTVIRHHNFEASRPKEIQRKKEHHELEGCLGKRAGEPKDVAEQEATFTVIYFPKFRIWEGQKNQGEKEKEKPAGGEDEGYKDEVVVVVQDQPTTAQPQATQILLANRLAPLRLAAASAPSMPKARAPTAVTCSSSQPPPDFRVIKTTVCNSTDNGAQDDIREYEFVFPTAPRPNNASQPVPVPVPASFVHDASAKFEEILADVLPQVHDTDKKFHVTIAVSATSVRLQPQFEERHNARLEQNRNTAIDQTFMANGRVLTFELGKDPSVRMGHILLTQLSGIIEPSLMPPSERGSGGDPLMYLADLNPDWVGLTPDGRAPRLHHSGPLIVLDTPARGENADIDDAGGWTVSPATSTLFLEWCVWPTRPMVPLTTRNDDANWPPITIAFKRESLPSLAYKTTYTPEARQLVTRTLEGLVDIVSRTRVIFVNQLRLLPDTSSTPFDPSIDEPTKASHILSYLSILGFLTNPELIVFEEEGIFYPGFPLNAPAIIPPVNISTSPFVANADFSPRPFSPASTTSYHPSSPPAWVNTSPVWDALSVDSDVMTFDYETWSTQAHVGTTPMTEHSSPLFPANSHVVASASADTGSPTKDLSSLALIPSSRTDKDAAVAPHLTQAEQAPPLPHRHIPQTVDPMDTIARALTLRHAPRINIFLRRLVTKPALPAVPSDAASSSFPQGTTTQQSPEPLREVNFTEATFSPLSNPISDVIARILSEDGHFQESPQ